MTLILGLTPEQWSRYALEPERDGIGVQCLDHMTGAFVAMAEDSPWPLVDMGEIIAWIEVHERLSHR